MYKKIHLVMLAFTAMLLTQCKDDNGSPLLDALIAPKVSLTFATENNTFSFSEVTTTNDDANPTYIDLNGNLTKDVGEELKALKEYRASTKNVTIFGHINSLLLTGQKSLTTIEVQNRFIQTLKATDCISLTNCKILKANSLEVIDISGSESVENIELSTNENFIKELREVVMTNPKLIGTKNFNEFLKRLPSRKDKEKKGVFKALSPVITQADVDQLEAKGWKKIF
jgi:hypothetical protein